MLQHASWKLVGVTLAWDYSSADVLKGLLMGLAVYLIALAVYVIARNVSGWGEDSPVPESRPLWIGPDLLEATEAARRLVDELRQSHGLEPLKRHHATDELAQHHAHDMAERSFCGPGDPDGIGLADRLVRLHPTMVATLSQWEHELRDIRTTEAPELARQLVAGSANLATGLAELALAEPLNCMGISVAGSTERITICIVFAHHWATLIPDRPHIERAGTWPIAAELVEGTTTEHLSATLMEGGHASGAQVPAENFSTDEWQDNRVCVYLNAGTNIDAVRLQWYRLSASSVPLPLP